MALVGHHSLPDWDCVGPFPGTPAQDPAQVASHTIHTIVSASAVAVGLLVGATAVAFRLNPARARGWRVIALSLMTLTGCAASAAAFVAVDQFLEDRRGPPTCN